MASGGHPTTNEELARELEAVKTRVGQLERQRNDAIDALASATGLSRRQVLGIIGGGAGMGALGMLASQEARGAASASDSDGDIGTPSSRADLFTDGINYSVADISSATTVSAPVVTYDCSVSGFTITLDSSLEPANGVQQVVLIDKTGNAGTNAVTVTATSNIDGGANITVNHDNAVTILTWDGAEWRSTRFIDTVDAGTLALSNQSSVKAFLSSDHSFSGANSLEVLPLDSEAFDVRGEFNTTNNDFTVDASGTYYLYATAVFQVGADGDNLQLFLRNNGSIISRHLVGAGGTGSQSVSLTDTRQLSAGDTIDVQVRNVDSADAITGGEGRTYFIAHRIA